MKPTLTTAANMPVETAVVAGRAQVGGQQDSDGRAEAAAMLQELQQRLTMTCKMERTRGCANEDDRAFQRTAVRWSRPPASIGPRASNIFPENRFRFKKIRRVTNTCPDILLTIDQVHFLSAAKSSNRDSSFPGRKWFKVKILVHKRKVV